MIDERWRRIKEVFQAAIEQPPAARDAFLDAATGIDDDVRREVRSLLRSDAPDDSLFDRLPLAGTAMFDDVLPGAPLARGFRVGVYEILTLVGSGSMGDVYHARDTQLNRDVALKILPPTFAHDVDRLARFRREAQVLATLDHRNIARIYGLEESSDVRALVLEFVDGPTLAERIAKDQFTLEEALHIGRQVADALAAAHDRGVIHRDLKPANIAIDRDGTVKVLDFGLAKMSPTDASTASPRVTATDINGRMLGTPTYMSPEQARGRPLDKRTDLWSFGCVLYELLCGRPPFAGETVADTLAAVLEHEVDDSPLSGAPPSLRRLLRRCLARDLAKRLDSAAAARLEIDEAISESAAGFSGGSTPVTPRTRLVIIAISAIALAVLVGFLVSRSSLLTPPGAVEARFGITTSTDWPLNVSGPMRDIAFSPDGRTLVYRAGGSMTAGSALMLRSMDRVDAALVPGATYVYAPFFSPDGQWIGFFSRSELKKVAVAGGTATTLCEFTGAPLGASWGDDGMIAFALSGPTGGLWRVSAKGGAAERLAAPDPIDVTTTYAFPSVLPNERGVLFTIEKGGQPGASQVAVIDLKTGHRKTLIDGAADAQYVQTGHLVFAAGGSLRAVRFNADRLDVAGEPVPLSDSVLIKQGGAADYALTGGGTLAYVTAESGVRPPRSLVWVDRRGREEPLDVPLRRYGPGRISPDGTRVAIGIMDNGSADIWIFDVKGGALKRLTFTPGTNGLPVWTPDGRQIIFSMYDQKGVLNLYRQTSDGSEHYESITSSQIPQWPSSVTPDGTRVIGFDLGRPPRPGGVTAVPLFGGAVGDVKSLFNGDFAESSPDGRYLAYQSMESGRSEVYVRAFPDVKNGPWQISTAGGTRPAWSRDGRELFYLDAANAMNVVRVDTSGRTFVSAPPETLFATGYYEPNPARHYDVSPDGQRFLMIKENPVRGNATPASMVVVQNWEEELKVRLPVR